MRKVILEFDSRTISVGRAARALEEASCHASRNNDLEWNWLLLDMADGRSYQLWRERIAEDIEQIMIVIADLEWPDRMKRAYEVYLNL